MRPEMDFSKLRMVYHPFYRALPRHLTGLGATNICNSMGAAVRNLRSRRTGKRGTSRRDESDVDGHLASGCY